VREYMFTDEEVKKEYQRHENFQNIDKLMEVKGKTLIYQHTIEDLKHEPEIMHMLKGISQAKDEIIDYDFKIKTCCWSKESHINIGKLNFLIILALNTNQAIFFDDEKIRIKFSLETSTKVRNIVTIQCVLVQEVVVLKEDNQKPKRRIEFELGIQSKQPDLPKGVSNAELEFSFDLDKIFSVVNQLTSSRFPTVKNESIRSIKSQLSQHRSDSHSNISRLKDFEKNLIHMGENLHELTPYTVKGNNIESNFYIKLEISLQRIIGGTFVKHHQFPILIRSRRLEGADH